MTRLFTRRSSLTLTRGQERESAAHLAYRDGRRQELLLLLSLSRASRVALTLTLTLRVLEVSFRDSHRLSLFARFIPRHMFSSAFSAVELRRRLSFFHCVFLSFFVSSFALDCSSDCSQEEPLLQSNGKGMS